MFRLLITFILAFVFVGCVQNEPMSTIRSGKDNFVQFPIGDERPRPTRSDYFISTGGSFALQLDEQHEITNCRCCLFIAPRKKIIVPLYLRSSFQNPTNSSSPFVVDTDVQPGSTNIMICSPDIRGFQSRHSYMVDVSVFDTPDRSKLIGVHDQFIQYNKPPFVK
jgi:hypothetical protein